MFGASSELASVMEFGFYQQRPRTDDCRNAGRSERLRRHGERRARAGAEAEL